MRFWFNTDAAVRADAVVHAVVHAVAHAVARAVVHAVVSVFFSIVSSVVSSFKRMKISGTTKMSPLHGQFVEHEGVFHMMNWNEGQ